MGVDKFIATGKSSAFGDVFAVRFTNYMCYLYVLLIRLNY
ncbi:hypothetical protein IMAU30156_01158 [Lactobacillus helveticus]|nr:hypothetical protein [Lactobacillus helveticus]NRN93843.1 hypothetical protein [Lactobacillus helveticus]NRO26795.1 hypothetical protein [Lactobacillus helveticus]NRO45302.1 hypothetical protein [Lactobacillus helveticus]NRO54695.1 hypothetical protein [Lactobacillus helveticus]